MGLAALWFRGCSGGDGDRSRGAWLGFSGVGHCFDEAALIRFGVGIVGACLLFELRRMW